MIAVILVVNTEVIAIAPWKVEDSEPDGPIVGFTGMGNPDNKQKLNLKQQEDYVVSKKGTSNFHLISCANWNCLKIK